MRHEVGVGYALIVLDQPFAGAESDYTDWYENDHFFASAMHKPWLFAGRRWIAPPELRRQRVPTSSSTFADPVNEGSQLTTFWIASGMLDEHLEWTREVTRDLAAQNRLFDRRRHVHAGFHAHIGTVYRDERVPRDIFSLVDPSPGLALAVLDVIGDQDPCAEWLLEEHLPDRVGPASAVLSAMVFGDTIAPPHDGTSSNRLFELAFLDTHPREDWEERASEEEALFSCSGRGTLAFLAPFLPRRMGTGTDVESYR